MAKVKSKARPAAVGDPSVTDVVDQWPPAGDVPDAATTGKGKLPRAVYEAEINRLSVELVQAPGVDPSHRA